MDGVPFTKKDDCQVELLLLNDFHTLFHSLHVEWYEVVVTLGQTLVKSLVQSIRTHHRAYLQQPA